MMKDDIGMTLPGQLDHPPGHIHAFDGKAMACQQIDDPAAAPAANVQGGAPCRDEGNRPLVLPDAVVAREVLAVPDVGDLIVAFGNVIGCHGVLAGSHAGVQKQGLRTAGQASPATPG